MDEYSVGEYIIYRNGEKYELGRIKSLREDGAFVAYHEGETGALTPYSHMHKLINRYCIKDTTLGGDYFKADTPQTDCDTCRHYKLACELFSEVCKYEPTTQTETQNSNLAFDTPQTERMTEEEIDTMLAKVLVGQTDCGWK